MRKGEIIDLCRQMAKICFGHCLEAVNAKTVDGDFGVDLGLDDKDVTILGFKEDVEHNCYILIFSILNYNDWLCEVRYDINTRKIETRMFKFINL